MPMPTPVLFLAVLLVALSACSRLTLQDGPPESGATAMITDGAPKSPIDLSKIAEPVPREEPRSRYGNPQTYSVNGRQYRTLGSAKGYRERGLASWYGTKFHGQRTSSGEIYDMHQFTAAHKTLPLPTYVQVTNLANNRSITVKVNDRGPFHDERIIDLSYVAAMKLGLIETGTATVEVKTIETTPRSAMPLPATPLPISASATPLPATPATEHQQPTLLPKTRQGDKFFQIGAFAVPANAQALIARLLRAGIPNSRIVPPRDNGDNFHRVIIGPIASSEKIPALNKQLEMLGIQDVKIYREPIPR